MRLPARLPWVFKLLTFSILGCAAVSDPTAPVTITVIPTPALLIDGIEGVMFCETDTTNCALTDHDGVATLQLPVDEEISYTLTKARWGSHLVPLVVPPEGLAFDSPITNETRLAEQHEQVASPYPLTDNGTISVFVYPRPDEDRIGATFNLVGASAKAFYGDDEFNWSLDLPATTSEGHGGFVEVPPGDGFQIEIGGTAENCVPRDRAGWPGDYENTVRFPVRAGYVTRVALDCPLPR